MIKSILDTDLYKFSTAFAYYSLYPNAEGTFKFNDRNKENWNSKEFINSNTQKNILLEEMAMQFYKLENLHLTDEEKNWAINNIPYIPAAFWEWLTSFRFESSKINYYLDDNGVFQCEVTDKLYKVTMYEIAILSTYAEVRNKIFNLVGKITVNYEDVSRIIKDKIEFANRNNIPFSEFGTRRRFNSDVHEIILHEIKNNSHTCTGTSNVYYAMKYNMKPSGTFPHEWMMFHAAIFGYKRANYLGLEDWVKVYDGNLGTALVDTYTTDSFLRTLTRKQAHLLSGFRQDSGDEYKVGNSIIKRLKEFGIDPKSKLIVFSNALDFDKAKDILEYFTERVKVGFGIGTNLTCDIGIKEYKPANIVMKLSKTRMSDKDPWEKCIKISDDIGKHMGDNYEFEIAKYELHIEN